MRWLVAGTLLLSGCDVPTVLAGYGAYKTAHAKDTPGSLFGFMSSLPGATGTGGVGIQCFATAQDALNDNSRCGTSPSPSSGCSHALEAQLKGLTLDEADALLKAKGFKEQRRGKLVESGGTVVFYAYFGSDDCLADPLSLDTDAFGFVVDVSHAQ